MTEKNDASVKSKLDIRSIKIYRRNDEEVSSDDENDIADILHLPERSTIKRNDDKFYQRLLLIENGIYNGTINEKFLREGQGTYSINNGEEYYSGEWKNDKHDGYGYSFKHYGSTIQHGRFENDILKEGYGKVQLPDQYEYEGKIKDDKFDGLGCLSIKVSGLTEIDRSSVQKDILKLVAEWKEGKTVFVYLNEIKQYYQYQYEVFQHSLESFIRSDDQKYQEQRQYLKILFNLFENKFNDFELLSKIVIDPNLPHKLKFSADLLFKLDHSYTNLNKYTQTEMKKSYNDCIHRICHRGLKNYIRTLERVENEAQIDLISSKIIFENDLNQFLEKSYISELKSILAVNPNVINLIKKLIRFANRRLIEIPSQYRAHFINNHTKFLQDLWKSYFQELNQDSIPDRFENDNDEKYLFYSDCYSNLLDLSIIDKFEFEIEIKAEKLENQENSSIVITCDKKILYQYTPNSSQFSLSIIVLDGKIGTKKTERVFTLEGSDATRFIKEIDPDDFIVSIFSNNTDKPVDINIREVFKDICNIEPFQLKKKSSWVFLIRKKDKKIFYKINLNSTEKSLIKEDMNVSNIESIIYHIMTFTLLHLKPWMDISSKDWSEYLEKTFQRDISIKEIGDGLLIKVLTDTKTYVLKFRADINRSFLDSFELMIGYYQNSLLKDNHLNYQSKMKGIKKIMDYFLQIFVDDNSHIQDLTKIQFESIKEFIQEKESITEIIDHFLNFNNEFFKLSHIFQEKFPPNVHSEFNKNSSKIISLITVILKLILEKEKISESNEQTEIDQASLLKKYETSNLGIALRKEAFEGNLIGVKVLLKSGVNTNEHGDNTKRTALHWAVIKKHKPIISYLLEKGANSEIKDGNNKSSVDYAKELEIDLNLLNKFHNTLFTMQKLNNFLTNLASLDIDWYVEGSPIKNWSLPVFENIGNNIYKVLQIDEGKKELNDTCPHYVLNAIIDLLEIIKNFNTMKNTSAIEMIRLRGELIMAIGKSLNYFKDQIKYNSLEKFKEECVVPFRDITVDNESYEIFCEKLEKIDLYFLYNRKLKEITPNQALKLFQERNESLVENEKITKTFLQYEKLFRKYFDDIIKKQTSIKHIIEQTKKLAKESNFKRETIPDIIAGLSIVLSLRVSDFIKEHKGEYVIKEKYNTNYLLQPHCIQILGVLMLLDIDGNTNSLPPNHLGEILTGQGKSWALALLAGYFSLIGYQVTIACYSDYLSQRDQNDFNKNFQPFHFENSVRYRTFEAMCNEKLSNKNSNKTLRDIISDIISGEKLSPINMKDPLKEKSILLIDEVDVFFSHQFGEMYYPAVSIKNENIAQIQKEIWEHIMTNKPDETQLKNFTDQRLFSLVNTDQMLGYLARSNSLKNHVNQMIDTAIEIYNDTNDKNILKDKFKIINNIIYAKDHEGKFTLRTIWHYQNSFYYLKLMYEKQESFKEVILKETNFGYFLIACGYISYSELPNSFDGIFGVSGSLKDLSSAENSLLKHYNINKKSYYPSFFGKSKLKFHKINDFTIKDCKDWFDTIVTYTRKRLAEERSVLIFFENEKLLDEFSSSCSGNLGMIPFMITQNKIFDGKEVKDSNDINVNKLIKDEYAGHHGKVTLLTREFGRGVDFQSETKVNEKGGIHVIQTFFSLDIKEEIQIKGRTARKDELGSYQLILCLEHLQEPEIEGGKILKYTGITNDTTYHELDRQRKEKTNSSCQDKLKEIEKNQEIHNRTLAFYYRALTECNDENRESFIKEIEKLKS